MEWIPPLITGLCTVVVALIEARAARDRKREKISAEEQEEKKKALEQEKKIQKEKMEAMELGVQSLLRDRIIERYNHYIEQEHIPIYGLENVTKMYESYHALGGNGTITELVNDLKALPHEIPEKE